MGGGAEPWGRFLDAMRQEKVVVSCLISDGSMLRESEPKSVEARDSYKWRWAEACKFRAQAELQRG